jgi:uncharacterized protein with HEPN domain
LDAIASIERLLAENARADIVADRHARAILERELEIISEASRRVPDPIKAEANAIDWRGMAALGNRLRHAYHLIDVEMLLLIATRDLPPLKTLVRAIIEEDRS